jgi:hypothetical protein
LGISAPRKTSKEEVRQDLGNHDFGALGGALDWYMAWPFFLVQMVKMHPDPDGLSKADAAVAGLDAVMHSAVKGLEHGDSLIRSQSKILHMR